MRTESGQQGVTTPRVMRDARNSLKHIELWPTAQTDVFRAPSLSRMFTNFESFVTNREARAVPFLLPILALVQNRGELGLGGHAHCR